MEEIAEQMFMMQVLQEVVETLEQIINLRQEKLTLIIIQLDLQEVTISLIDQAQKLIPNQVEDLLLQEVATVDLQAVTIIAAADLQEVAALVQVDLLLQGVAQQEVAAAKVVLPQDRVDQEDKDNL